MHTSAVEETTLTDKTNEQQPAMIDTPVPQSEPETTALVPAEPDVIEGEVIELAPPENQEDQIPPKQRPYGLLVPLTVLACLLFLAGSYLLPLFTPTATITIIPIERTVTITTAIQVHATAVSPRTLSQSATVAATGKRQQSATRAAGTITFYNGLLTSQTIAAGTVFTGSDATQVVTDKVATIPAANPPLEGQVTVSAHAIATGASGNIPAYDINQA